MTSNTVSTASKDVALKKEMTTSCHIPTTISSYDCAIKLKNQSKPSVLIDLLKGFKTKVDVFAYDLHNHRTKVDDNNELCRFLEEQGCTLTLKIFRTSFPHKNDTVKKSPKDVFMNELARASLVRSAVGNESFYTYTTYRFFNDSCGFAVRPAKGSKIRLSLQHKTDYQENDVEEIYIILQEACAYTLENLKHDAKNNNTNNPNNTNMNINMNRGYNKVHMFDAQEMDQCISKILKVLHENGIVHKDIRPSNIVYCPFSYVRYKLLNYAFAATSTVIPKTITGSKMFMSPFYVAYMSKTTKQKHAQEIISLYDAHPGFSRYYKVLIKGHLVSLRRSKQLDTHGYLELKNDEYAYMMTLFSIYTQMRDPVLLARATGMSMCTNTVFA